MWRFNPAIGQSPAEGRDIVVAQIVSNDQNNVGRTLIEGSKGFIGPPGSRECREGALPRIRLPTDTSQAPAGASFDFDKRERPQQLIIQRRQVSIFSRIRLQLCLTDIAICHSQLFSHRLCQFIARAQRDGLKIYLRMKWWINRRLKD